MKNQSRTANVKIKSKPSSIQSSKQDPNVTVHKIQISSSQMGAKMGLKKLWNIVPLFIKFMSLSTLTLCILNLFLKNISYLLSNIPLNTIFHIQIWRLFSSALITTSIINVILGLIFWTREGSSLETRLGTMKYIIIFIRNTFLIELLYTIIISIISLIIKNKNFLAKKINNKGKAKYYPFIWFVVFCCVNNYHNDIEVLTGIIFAFLYQYFLRYYLNIPDSLIEKMENNCCCRWMLKIRGFVSVSHITNKFIDEKTNQRMSGQILNINKANQRKKAKISGNSNERDVKISTTPSEYTNRSENSIISNATPTSLFENSFDQNKNPNA